MLQSDAETITFSRMVVNQSNRGGRRAGAGRKPGAAWFGKGAPAPDMREYTLADVGSAAALAPVATGGAVGMIAAPPPPVAAPAPAAGLTDPLQILVAISADPRVDVGVRVTAAAQAVKYIHPALSAAVVARLPVPDSRAHEALIDRLTARLGKVRPSATIANATPAPATLDTAEQVTSDGEAFAIERVEPGASA